MFERDQPPSLLTAHDFKDRLDHFLFHKALCSEEGSVLPALIHTAALHYTHCFTRLLTKVPPIGANIEVHIHPQEARLHEAEQRGG